MILLAPEVSFVTLHMRWHKGCFPKASTKIKQNFTKRGRIEGERAPGLILQQSAAGTGRGVAYDRKAKRLEQEMNQTMWCNTIVVEFCNQLNHIRQVEKHHG